MALNPAKASPVALRNAAQGLLDKQKYAEAESYLLEVLRRNVNDPAALALMAEVCAAKGLIREGLTCIMAAVNADPAELRYKERLTELADGIAATVYDEMAERAIIECLKSGETLDCTRLQRFWLSHLFLAPAFHAAFGLLDRKVFDPANKAWFESLRDFSPLLTPFFLLGLRHIDVADARLEDFITHIRKHLLEKKKFTPEEYLTLASAISHYCFHTGYILDCTEEEQKATDALRIRIEGSSETGPASIALFACYAPLYTLNNADAVAQAFSTASPDLADLAKTQILDYITLRRAAADIIAITPIDNAVSAQVREQYEEFPYPQWKLMARESVCAGWKSRNGKFAESLFGRKINILSAGCGTGQETVMLSAIFPEAEILAVDLSRSSLAYAVRKAEDYGINNITFQQADILRLGALDQKFDLISSMGVLHHMQDPVRGWQVLCGLLKPGGLMIVGLYSKIARENILRTREEIKRRGYGSTAADMSRFRRESPRFLEKPVLSDIAGWRDYYFMPMYRDLLFHVQEHDYDLAEIEDILKKLQLEFPGFSLRQSVLSAYSKQYPDDPDRDSLKNWRLFEEKNPQTFREMYYLWCRKPL
jgi:SAM-dependent methyltransferase